MRVMAQAIGAPKRIVPIKKHGAARNRLITATSPALLDEWPVFCASSIMRAPLT